MPSGGRGVLFLVGFMGAGKTTIGRALAALVDREFLDLDEALVEIEGRSIARILQESGEAYFRERERQTLEKLRRRSRLVVACGGGTYAHEPSRRVIDAAGRAVWLQVPLAVALERCGTARDRPLLGSPEQAHALYQARLPSYRAAPLHVDVDGLTPEEAAARIAALL
jgi:shikimate kinase